MTYFVTEVSVTKYVIVILIRKKVVCPFTPLLPLFKFQHYLKIGPVIVNHFPMGTALIELSIKLLK